MTDAVGDGAPPAADAGTVSWQELRRARDVVATRWPSPLRLPLVHRASDVLYGRLRGDERILDVGAGDGARARRITERFPGVRCTTVDPDPNAGADHERVEDLPEDSFDVATLFEVLEHVPAAGGIELLRDVVSRVRPRGFVVVSVPATHTPGRYLRDCTHVTPWAHDELGAALTLAGLRVESMHRSYPGPWLRRTLRIALLGPVGRLFGVGYAHSTVALAVVPD